MTQIWQPNGCSPCPIWIYRPSDVDVDSVPKEQNGASGTVERWKPSESFIHSAWYCCPMLPILTYSILTVICSNARICQDEPLQPSNFFKTACEVTEKSWKTWPTAGFEQQDGRNREGRIFFLLGTIWGLINLTRHAFGCIWNAFGMHLDLYEEKHGQNFEYMTTQIWFKLHLFHVFLVSRTLGTPERSLFLSCTMMIVRPYGCVGWVGVGLGWGGGRLLSPAFPDALDAMLLASWRKFPKRSWCYALDVFT